MCKIFLKKKTMYSKELIDLKLTLKIVNTQQFSIIIFIDS